MQLTFLNGYPDFVGKRAIFVGYGNGPVSYNLTHGDPIILPLTNWYIDAVTGSTDDPTYSYWVIAKPSGVGTRKVWAMFWDGAANGDNLSMYQIQIGGFCGQY